MIRGNLCRGEFLADLAYVMLDKRISCLKYETIVRAAGCGGVLILLLALLMVAAARTWHRSIRKRSPSCYRPPGAEHWFGTDQLGRDIFSRVLVGARSTILLSLLATALAMVIGSVLVPPAPALAKWMNS